MRRNTLRTILRSMLIRRKQAIDLHFLDTITLGHPLLMVLPLVGMQMLHLQQSIEITMHIVQPINQIVQKLFLEVSSRFLTFFSIQSTIIISVTLNYSKC